MTCEYVQELMKQGRFDLRELQEHVDECSECRRLIFEVMTDVFDALERGETYEVVEGGQTNF